MLIAIFKTYKIEQKLLTNYSSKSSKYGEINLRNFFKIKIIGSILNFQGRR